jgi:heme oxygenase (biliverdin-IX-beta and delta-forming)
MITDKLREQTRPQHESIESATPFKILMSPELSQEQYAHIVSFWYSYVKPCEETLRHNQALKEWMPDLESRYKTTLLEEDLRNLGLDPQDIPNGTITPPLNNTAQMLGFIYVMEGSSMGAQLIVRKLKEHNWHSEGITNFYAGYKKDNGKMWSAFKKQLLALELSEAEEDQVVESAKQTFASLEQWMNLQGQQHLSIPAL